MSNQPERVLFVHAHPDDESIATGGTIATLVDLGVVVTVLPTEERAMTRRCFSPGTYNSADNLVHGKYALMPEIHAKLGRVFDACLSPKTGPHSCPSQTNTNHPPTAPLAPAPLANTAPTLPRYQAASRPARQRPAPQTNNATP
jgi:hypothetical protein